MRYPKDMYLWPATCLVLDSFRHSCLLDGSLEVDKGCVLHYLTFMQKCNLTLWSHDLAPKLIFPFLKTNVLGTGSCLHDWERVQVLEAFLLLITNRTQEVVDRSAHFNTHVKCVLDMLLQSVWLQQNPVACTLPIAQAVLSFVQLSCFKSPGLTLDIFGTSLLWAAVWLPKFGHHIAKQFLDLWSSFPRSCLLIVLDLPAVRDLFVEVMKGRDSVAHLVPAVRDTVLACCTAHGPLPHCMVPVMQALADNIESTQYRCIPTQLALMMFHVLECAWVARTPVLTAKLLSHTDFTSPDLRNRFILAALNKALEHGVSDVCTRVKLQLVTKKHGGIEWRSLLDELARAPACVGDDHIPLDMMALSLLLGTKEMPDLWTMQSITNFFVRARTHLSDSVLRMVYLEMFQFRWCKSAISRVCAEIERRNQEWSSCRQAWIAVLV